MSSWCWMIGLLLVLTAVADEPPSLVENDLRNLKYGNDDCPLISFERKFLVTLQGRPGNITKTKIQAFQNSWLQIYNSVASCNDSSSATFRRVTNVAVRREAVVSYGYNYLPNSVTDYLDQQFTWIVDIQGYCQGCNSSESFQTFASDPLPPGIAPCQTYPPGCACHPPYKYPFLHALNSNQSKYPLPSSIDQVLDVSVLYERNCSNVVVEFDTYLAVSYVGGTNTTATAWQQTNLLAQSVLETYNDENALNTAGVCDTQYRTLSNISVAGTSITTSTGIGNSSSKRGLSSFTSRRNSGRHDLSVFSNPFSNFTLLLILKVRGTCRGCPNKVPLFNDVTTSSCRNCTKPKRRQLRYYLEESPYDRLSNQIDLVKEENEAHFPEQYNSIASSSSSDVTHRQLPILAGGCYCQGNATNLRSPTKTELVQALNDRFEVINGVVTIVSAVQSIAQVTPVACPSTILSLKTFVRMTFQTNNVKANISKSKMSLIATAFQSTYNTISQQQYCDPLFRSVTSVQAVQVVAVHSTKTASWNVRFQVNLQCRGCPTRTTTLFAAAATKTPRYHRSMVHDRHRIDEGRINVDDENVEQHRSDPSEGVPQQQRQLASSNNSLCYCLINATATDAPSVNSFRIAFQKSIQTLDKSLTVFNVST